MDDALIAIRSLFDLPNAVMDRMEAMNADAQLISALQGLEGEALRTAVANFSLPRLSPKRGLSAEEKEWGKRFSDGRTAIKKRAERANELLNPDFTQLERELPAIQAQLRGLAALVKRTHQHFREEKNTRNCMDFGDMEQYTLDILEQPEVRAQMQGEFDHIFVDECQDVSQVQDAILQAIHGEQNCLFMVGDVKQAIYRFRLAAPEIFLEKSRRGAGKVIHMNENFRSNAGVIAAVNHVMSCIMSMELGEMEYTDEQHLRARGDFSGGAELLLTQPNGEESAAAEAKTIAARILELVGSIVTYRGEPRVLQFGDFAVLMRSPKTHSRTFYQVFEECGIPASVQTGSANGLFEPEVFVNLLRIIDGARSDIALLSVLKSHIGAFSDEEIAQIRAYSDSERFSDCLAEYLESEPSPLKDKITSFSERLNRWRLMSHGMPARRLIAALRSETDYDAFVRALPGGARRLTLLEKFFEKLNSLADECTCLFELVEDLDRLKREKGAYFDLPGELNDDRVRIMSIHKSKGLEFPVVILAQMNKSFNQRDLSAKLLFHPELGAACDIIDPERKTEDKSKIKLLLAEDLKAKNKSEELRILYVAMT